jgi:putative N6-adenine-specific DNA methylase
LARLPWHAYLSPESKIEVSVTCHKSRLYHSDAVAERVSRAIEQSFAGSGSQGRKSREPASDGTSQEEPFTARVFARIENDVVQVSVDASGDRLHRRGYRTHVVDAPLRETLAAALARFGITNGATERLWDPCCGSGTIGAEWLSTLLNVSPVRSSYALDHWPLAKHQQTPAADEAFTSAEDVASVKDGANPGTTESGSTEPRPAPHVWLSDKDPRAIEAARHNLTQANLASHCNFQIGDFESVAESIPSNTAVITNPPYGVRLTSSNEANALFQRLTTLLQRRTDLRPAIVLGPESFTSSSAGRHWAPIARFPNGGVTVLVLRLR